MARLHPNAWITCCRGSGQATANDTLVVTFCCRSKRQDDQLSTSRSQASVAGADMLSSDAISVTSSGMAALSQP